MLGDGQTPTIQGDGQSVLGDRCEVEAASLWTQKTHFSRFASATEDEVNLLLTCQLWSAETRGYNPQQAMPGALVGTTAEIGAFTISTPELKCDSVHEDHHLCRIFGKLHV